jgi:regulatory protein
VNEERLKKWKASAQRFTAYRERSPKEVADKLREWDAPQEAIDRILNELIADKFIDELRFARAFCHDKFLINKWGKRRIAMEISRHDLSHETIQQGLNYINQEEYDSTVHRLALAKWSKLKDKDVFVKKQKTVAYLTQKGYESDLIWATIKKFVN